MAPVRKLLGVRDVWHDSTADLAAQRFVLWATRLLERREEVEALLPPAPAPAAAPSPAAAPAAGAAPAGGGGGSDGGSMSLLVHCDADGPEVELLPARTLLQVRLRRLWCARVCRILRLAAVLGFAPGISPGGTSITTCR